MNKKRIVKDYDKLPEEVIIDLQKYYPSGYSEYLINIPNKEGKMISALPFETEEIYYLIRMTFQEAEAILGADSSDNTPVSIPEAEFEGEGEEETEIEESDDNVTVQLKQKGSYSEDGYEEDDENEPSESPDYA